MTEEARMVEMLANAGPSVLLALAVLALWRRDEKRDHERLQIGARRDERIAALEHKQDEHANQYRELAERVADVVGQTKHVMERVLEKLG